MPVVDLIEVAEVLIAHIRRTDELAAMVEACIDEEHADHELAVGALRRGHQRRTVGLSTLAGALAVQHGQLEELAHQLGIDTFPTEASTPAPGGAR